MMNGYGIVGAMRTGRGNGSAQENLPQWRGRRCGKLATVLDYDIEFILISNN
jgi:hypothetical protein